MQVLFSGSVVTSLPLELSESNCGPIRKVHRSSNAPSSALERTSLFFLTTHTHITMSAPETKPVEEKPRSTAEADLTKYKVCYFTFCGKV